MKILILFDFKTWKTKILFSYLEWLKFFFVRHMTGNLKFLVPTARTTKFMILTCVWLQIKNLAFRGWLWNFLILLILRLEKLNFYSHTRMTKFFFVRHMTGT